MAREKIVAASPPINPLLSLPDTYRKREMKLEIKYLPVLMEGNVSKLFKTDYFTVNQIAGMWKGFEVDLSKAYLYDAETITANFIDYWEQ